MFLAFSMINSFLFKEVVMKKIITQRTAQDDCHANLIAQGMKTQEPMFLRSQMISMDMSRFTANTTNL